MIGDLRSIIIVGGGTAGWIAAAMLSQFVPATTRIALIESSAIGTVGVGEATIPQIRLLTGGLGIDEDALLAATRGTFKLGIEFVDWLRPGHRYMHAFGQVGRGFGVVPFHHHWLRGLAADITEPLTTYMLSATAALEGRFARPPQAPPGLSYAYHFDASLLAPFLREQAEVRGVVRAEGRIIGAERSDTGDVAAVMLDDGRRISGDFFVDCSGIRSLLLGETLGVGYEDWTGWLPCDRAMAVPCEQLGAILPYTRATAKPVGWQWRIPLQHRIGNGLVYSSNHLSDDEAAANILGALDGRPLADPNALKFTTGKRNTFWARNVVGIGLASGFMEPLESTSIHMVQSAVARLLELFPARAGNDALRDTYNRLTHAEYDRIRDFLILHYKATERDEPFWRQCRDTPIPDTLAAKIDLFRSSGRISPEPGELFTESAWLQVLIGQGIAPNSWSPLARKLPIDSLARFLADQRSAVSSNVEGLPLHADYIRALERA